MRKFSVVTLGLALVAFAVLPACGGSGQGYRVSSDPLVITSTSLPASLSGQFIDFEVPLTGGCGGPYVMAVIQGTLPAGIAIDVAGGRHHLVGYLLEDGTFPFTLQITDTSCEPFLTTTAQFTWSIGIGPLTIVDSNPASLDPVSFGLIDPQAYPDLNAFPTTVFNEFTAIVLVAAGGIPPYSLSIVDDPNDPDDGALPLGVTIPPNSMSIVGSPVQVKAGGIPFRLTFQVTDSTGATGVRQFQWKIDTPPIRIANTDLPDGKAGSPYGDAIQVVDGVPPFQFELVDDIAATVIVDGEPVFDVTYASPAAPTVNTTVKGGTPFTLAGDGTSSNQLFDGSPATYPAPATFGPYDPMPPEGLYLQDTGAGAGTISGFPRRFGNFTIYVHVSSTLVPNEQGQHAWAAFNFTIAPSEPPTVPTPPYGINYSFTDEGVLVGPPNHSTIPEFNYGASYNPDGGQPGLQLLAQGGVGFDGFTDAPHASQRTVNAQEVAGNYTWEVLDWDVAQPGVQGPPPGIDLLPAPAGATFSDGRLGLTGSPFALVRASRKLLQMRARDQQLPTTNQAQDNFGYSVGPDKVIVIESSNSYTGAGETSSGGIGLHDPRVRVRVFQVLGGVPQIADLGNADLSPTHSVPTVAGVSDLGQLLSGKTGGDANLDVLRVAVNPTGFWDDLSALNVHAARPYQATDHGYNAYSYWGMTYNSSPGFQPDAPAVAIPNCRDGSVTHQPFNGIYTNGGKLYAFESLSRFGFFLVRHDGSITVPFAYQKDAVFGGLGDGILEAFSTTSNLNATMRIVQITVSPDGRFAAAKLKRNHLDYREGHTLSAVVLMDLTGTKFFAGETYKIVGSTDTALTQTATNGGPGVLHATSMALTNRCLYFLIGNYAASSSTSWHNHAKWRDHYVMRYEVKTSGGTAGTAVAASLATGVGANWTQTPTTPMQTPFHHWQNPTASVYFSTFQPTFTSGFTQGPNNEVYLYDGANLQEFESAPIPFRVNWDGNACALLAGTRHNSTSTSVSGADVNSHNLWVDWECDASGFRQASTTERRCPNGAGRGYRIHRGPSTYYGDYGYQSGPVPHLEISRDGKKVAYVYFDTTATISSNSSYKWTSYREHIAFVQGTDGGSNPWDTTLETLVTKNYFTDSPLWRMGMIVFAKDGSGIFFWAGMSTGSPTSASTTYQNSWHFTGSIYSFTDDGTATGGARQQVLAAADGGTSAGYATYDTSTNQNNPSGASYAGTPGKIRPVTGFISKNGNFFYVSTKDAIATGSTAKQSSNQLLGVNISTTDTGSGNINGHTNGRGFTFPSWPARRGFLPNYYHYTRYTFDYRYFVPGKWTFGPKMAKDTGWVYFASYYQSNGPSTATSTSFGGPDIATYWGDYNYYAGHIQGFNAEVGGPIARLSQPSLGGDTTSSSGYRSVQYIEVTDDGSQLLWVYNTFGYLRAANTERLGHIRNIAFDPNTGALSPSFDPSTHAILLESGNSRLGEGMSFASTGTKIYYAHTTAGNENAKQMVEATVDPGTGNVTFGRFFSGARYSVLHSGR